MTPEEKQLSTTLRWYITNKWGDPDAQAEALDVADELIGYTASGQPVAPIRPTKPQDGSLDLPEVTKSARVALLVGHNSRAPGAWVKPPLNESEYVFNNQVANLVMEKGVEGVTFRRFNRTHGGGYSSEIRRVYAKINAFDPDLVLDMHFNGGGGHYCFMLYAHGSQKSRAAAAAMSPIFAEAIGATDYGDRPLKSGGRGYLSVIASPAPTVLTEPFFGDNQEHADAVARLGHDGIADLYRLAIVAALSSLS